MLYIFINTIVIISCWVVSFLLFFEWRRDGGAFPFLISAFLFIAAAFSSLNGLERRARSHDAQIEQLMEQVSSLQNNCGCSSQEEQ